MAAGMCRSLDNNKPVDDVHNSAWFARWWR